MRLAFLLLLITVLIGCSSVAGDFSKAHEVWARQPTTFSIHPSPIVCVGNEDIVLNFSVSEDLIYKQLYLWNEQKKSWDSKKVEGSEVGRHWVKNRGTFTLEMSCSQFISNYVDKNSEMFSAVFSCTKQDVWNCHKDKWQLSVLKVQPLDSCAQVYLTLQEEKVIRSGQRSATLQIIGGSTDASSVILNVDGVSRTVRAGDILSVGDVSVFIQDALITEIPSLSVALFVSVAHTGVCLS